MQGGEKETKGNTERGARQDEMSGETLGLSRTRAVLAFGTGRPALARSEVRGRDTATFC